MVVGEVMNGVVIKYSTKLLKAFALSENMQQNEGSQPDQSCESPSNMQPIPGNLSSDYKNPSNLEGSYVGCVSNPNSSEYATSAGTTYNQQPETLNLPAVLWDKPLGSKIRVPPPSHQGPQEDQSTPLALEHLRQLWQRPFVEAQVKITFHLKEVCHWALLCLP
jgi:hypothetical protein